MPVAPTDRISIRRRSGKGAGSPQGGGEGPKPKFARTPTVYTTGSLPILSVSLFGGRNHILTFKR